MRTTLWLAAGVLLVAGGRACLPVAIEKGIELGGEQIVQADVEVNDVDLHVLRGALSIEGLRMVAQPQRASAPLLDVARVEIDAAPLALFSGRIHVESVAVEQSALSLEVSEDGRLRLPLRVEPSWPEWIPALQVDHVSLAGLQLRVDDPFDSAPALALDCGLIELSDLYGHERRVRIAALRVDAPELTVDREVAVGERSVLTWVDLSGLPTQATPETEPLPAVAAASDAIASEPPPLEITLDRLLVEQAALHWVDRSFQPPLEERDEGLRLEARDVVVHEQQLSALDVEGRALRGEPFRVALRSEEGAWLADVSASRVKLATFDPYSRQLADFGLQRGEVSVTSRLRLRDGTLHSESDLQLHGVRLEGASSLRSFLGVSANLALALLEDDAGDIALSVPVELRPGDDLDRVMQRAVQGGVLAALQGALVDLDGAVDADGFRIAPLPAVPGAAELHLDGEAQLASLGGLLRRQRELVAVLTGTYAAADREALARRERREPETIRAAELREIAERRADAARRALIETHRVPERSVRLADPVDAEAPGVRLELASSRD